MRGSFYLAPCYAQRVTVPGDLGVLETKDGYRYQITPDDLLWLARSTQFEGADHAATIWAFAQRFAGIQRSGTFTDLIRAYSQPVNPLWDEASDPKCITSPHRCSPETLARRQRARTITWAELNPAVRAAVLAFAQASLPNPLPRATDFASYDVRQWLRLNPTAQILKSEPGGNWYSTHERSNGWPVDFVYVRFRDRLSVVASGGGSGGFGFWGAFGLGVLGAAGLVGLVFAARRWG